MSKWQIVLANIGRDKVCKNFTANVPTLPHVEHLALRLCNQYLTSKDISMIHDGDLNYTIYAAGCNVGKVSIRTA